MTTTHNERLMYYRVGVVVVIAIAIFVGALVVTGPLRWFRGVPVYVDFGFAGPIKPGAAVRISGIVVGAVEEIIFVGGTDVDAGRDVMVRLRLSVDDRAMNVLTHDAHLYVTTLGVLGEHYVDVSPRPTGERLVAGARIRGIDLPRSDLLLPRAAGMLETASALATTNGDEIKKLLERFMDVSEKLVNAASGPGLGEMQATLVEARALIVSLRTGIGDGAALKSSIEATPPLLRSTEKTVRAFGESGFLEAGDHLGPLIEKADPFVGEAREALAESREIMRDVRGGLLLNNKRQEELARTFEKTFVELEKIGRSGNNVLEQMADGKGAVGEAFQDRQLILDLKAVLRQLRKNPAGLLLPFGAEEPNRAEPGGP